jgi:hypothetical protein
VLVVDIDVLAVVEEVEVPPVLVAEADEILVPAPPLPPVLAVDEVVLVDIVPPFPPTEVEVPPADELLVAQLHPPAPPFPPADEVLVPVVTLALVVPEGEPAVVVSLVASPEPEHAATSPTAASGRNEGRVLKMEYFMERRVDDRCATRTKPQSKWTRRPRQI